MVKEAHGLSGVPHCTTPMLMAMGGESDSEMLVFGYDSVAAYAVNGGRPVWRMSVNANHAIVGSAHNIHADVLLLSITVEGVLDADSVAAYSLSTGELLDSLHHPHAERRTAGWSFMRTRAAGWWSATRWQTCGRRGRAGRGVAVGLWHPKTRTRCGCCTTLSTPRRGTSLPRRRDGMWMVDFIAGA